jgi:hypothetical protein
MYIYYEMHSAIKNILDEDVCSFKTYNFCVGERHVIKRVMSYGNGV